MSEADKLNVDSIISRLLEGKILDNSISLWYKRYCILCHIKTTVPVVKTGAQHGCNVALVVEGLSRFLCYFSSRKSPRKKCTIDRS